MDSLMPWSPDVFSHAPNFSIYNTLALERQGCYRDDPRCRPESGQLQVQLVVIDTNIIIYVEAKKEKITRPVNQPSEPDAEL